MSLREAKRRSNLILGLEVQINRLLRDFVPRNDTLDIEFLKEELMMDSLLFAIKTFKSGGILMYIIFLVGMIILAVITERFRYLYFKSNLYSYEFMNEIIKCLRIGRVEEAINLCDTLDKPLSRIVKVGLLNRDSGVNELQGLINEAILYEIPHLKVRINLLQILAYIEILLGLLGIFLGLTPIFNGLSINEFSNFSSWIIKIQRAFYTIIFSLIIAIPTLGFYAYLKELSESLVKDIEAYSIKLMNFLTLRSN